MSYGLRHRAMDSTVLVSTVSPVAYAIGLSASLCLDRHRSSAHGYPGPLSGARERASCCIGCNIARFQLQPLVLPQPSQT